MVVIAMVQIPTYGGSSDGVRVEAVRYQQGFQSLAALSAIKRVCVVCKEFENNNETQLKWSHLYYYSIPEILNNFCYKNVFHIIFVCDQFISQNVILNSQKQCRSTRERGEAMEI